VDFNNSVTLRDLFALAYQISAQWDNVWLSYFRGTLMNPEFLEFDAANCTTLGTDAGLHLYISAVQFKRLLKRLWFV